MPAVQLEQLRKQIQSLTSSYSQPVEFHRHLIELLERHADLTFRPGQAGKLPPPMVESFHVSPIVLQQIESALVGEIAKNPSSALDLADELWSDTRLETRTLAAMVIGLLPSDQADQILMRIKTWAQPDTDKIYLTVLFNQGSAALRRSMMQNWIEAINLWLGSPDPASQRLGILALLPIVQDRTFENLPVVFKIISPALHSYQEGNKNELRAFLVALCRRSPAETSFFIRQTLSLSNDPRLAKMVRSCLPDFPEEARSRLRSFMLTLPR